MLPPALHHDLIDRWAEAWTDEALEGLLAYETGRVLGEAVLSAISAGSHSSEWVLAQLLEAHPLSPRQRELHSGLVDAVTQALRRLAVSPDGAANG